MALKTSNRFGEIIVSDYVVSKIVEIATLRCYGVVGLASEGLVESLLSLIRKKPLIKGIKIVTTGNKVYIDIYVTLKHGIQEEAVVDSLKSSVIYSIEHFLGMLVKSINVHVMGYQS